MKLQNKQFSKKHNIGIVYPVKWFYGDKQYFIGIKYPREFSEIIFDYPEKVNLTNYPEYTFIVGGYKNKLDAIGVAKRYTNEKYIEKDKKQ